MSLNKTVLLATGNPGKILEIRAILSSLDLNLKSIIHSEWMMKVHETGKTYADNARIKAEAYQKKSELITLADDSGLEVDALSGAPGIHSARYSPKPDATDADRRQYLIQQLETKPQPWTAQFHCTAVLFVAENLIYETTGRCDGVIIPVERGVYGFGYDPVFYLPEYKATMAEISADLKNRISHRAKALTSMIPILEQLFNLEDCA